MIFSLFKKSPALRTAPDLASHGEGVQNETASSPRAARVRASGAGEAAFAEKNCAIWNDIQRALESK